VLRRAGVVLALLCLAVALGACGSSDNGNKGAATGDNSGAAAEQSAAAPKPNADLKGEIKIGAIAPLTGASATIGKDQARGAELAVDKVNSGEGVLGKKLAVEVADSEASTVGSVQAARKLVTVNKVPVVIGEFLSANTIAAGKYLLGANVVHINPGSSSPDIAKIGSSSFSTIGLDNIAGKTAAKNVYGAGVRKMAFFGPNNAYGSEFAKVLKREFEAMGGQVVSSTLYTEGQKSYRAELQRMKDSGAEMYVYATYDPDAITINKEAFQLGLDAKKFYGIYLSICVEGVDPAATEGQQGQDLSYTGPNGGDYKAAYKAKFGSDPKTPYGGYVYDAVMMTAKAINDGKSAKSADIQAALKKVGASYDGATGTIAFDANNQRKDAPYDVLKVDGSGKLVPQQSVAMS
jgi:branched-chain amino acid transport system substrate-binding protein